MKQKLKELLTELCGALRPKQYSFPSPLSPESNSHEEPRPSPSTHLSPLPGSMLLRQGYLVQIPLRNLSRGVKNH